MQHKLFRLFFVLTLIIGLVTVPTPQSVRAAGPWYVSTTGSDANDCLRPTTTCATINGAIGKASNGDTVYVAEGLYTGIGSEVVLIDKNITLSGGWDAGFSFQGTLSRIDGQGTRRGINVLSGVVASVERFNIRNGFLFNTGGGIFNLGTLTLNSSIVSSNSTDFGGGIANSGTLTLNDVIVGSNSATTFGGGILNNGTLTLNNSTVRNNSSTTFGGGGIANSGGVLTLNNSTVYDNSTNDSGGGIVNAGGPTSTMTLNNSTVSGNSAIDGGGGIANFSGTGTVTLNYSTITNNTSDSDNDGSGDGGGIINGNSNGSVTLQSSIMAGNKKGPGGVNDFAADCSNSGAMISQGYNLTGSDTGCDPLGGTGDVTVTPANVFTDVLGPLGDYGGPISAATHALIDSLSNPALNAIPSGTNSCGSTPFDLDQRGVTRPQVTACDIGAFELEQAAVPPPANDNFANVEVITSLPFSATADITGATNESGEQQICYYMPNTIWYAFTPTETMAIQIGTHSGAINANVNIYSATGSGISNLQFLLCSSPGGSPTFHAEAGQTYYFQVGGVGQVGNVQINLEQIPPPANDNFAAAESINSLPFNASTDISGAWNEPNEPQNCYTMLNTVWYTFTPTETVMIQTDTQGSNIDRNVNIYHAGTGISDLQFLSCTSNNGSSTFLAEAGQTYYLQAGGINGALGIILVNLKQVFPPANDNFANAEAVTSMPFSTTADITTAGNEPNEPQNCSSMPNTVWYSFTPTETMMIQAYTQGGNFDTNMNVYRAGSGISDLQFLLCSSYGRSNGTPFNFLAEAGQTYYLQVGGINGGIGTIQVNLKQVFPPVNDDFANAEAVTSMPFSTTVDITDATNEPSEPQYCYSMPNTVWYSFTPTETTFVRADTQGSAINSNLNVYKPYVNGSGVTNLNFLGCTVYNGPITFLAEAGETYYLQLGALNGELGNVQINLTELPRPNNDDFAHATVISTFPFTDTVENANATVEAGEPLYWCYTIEKTLWYSFTPTETVPVRLTTLGSTAASSVNIYRSTGGGFPDLSFINCTGSYGDSFSFLAEAGVTYYFQASLFPGQVGSIQLNLEQLPLPANDNFANAISVNALPSTIDFDNTWATFQSGEPSPSCAYPAPPYKTGWFAHTALQDGSVSASVPSSNFSPFMAVYSGTDLNNLTQLGCGQYSNKVTFHVVSGQTYYFQVGGFYGGGGTGQFLLETTPAPQAYFYNYPGDPSKFDTIQFYDGSSDPGQVGFQTHAWNFGDGSTASGYSATHKYATDGDYQVTHTVTTIDGRTASVTQTVPVRTHDVAITKITTPNSANVGQTKTITVTLRNTAYPETVQIDLYKSTPNGFVWIATVTKSVPALSGNRTTAVNFSYKFTSDDAKIGKVTFKAVATIVGARDSYPSDNEKISLITKVAK